MALIKTSATTEKKKTSKIRFIIL